MQSGHSEGKGEDREEQEEGHLHRSLPRTLPSPGSFLSTESLSTRFWLHFKFEAEGLSRSLVPDE